jgi:uncharacterized protein (TIGR03435 family)
VYAGKEEKVVHGWATRQRAAALLFAMLIGSVRAWPQKAIDDKDILPKFDAVSIRQIEAYEKVTTSGSASYTFALHKPCVYSEDKLVCQLSLAELIWEAYQRKRYEVVGPSWLGEDVFVFQGIFPEKTDKEGARHMMQNALEDRFGIICHVEKKLIPVYEMVAGSNGLHLTPVDPSDQKQKLTLDGHPGASVVRSNGEFSALALSLDELGLWIANTAGLDRPVLNGTGLHDRYKIDLHWDPESNLASDGGSQNQGILTALRKQTGLLLKKDHTMTEVLVIDHINRTPTPN